MPVIQQEKGVKSVAGLPERWGRRAYAELRAAMAALNAARAELKAAEGKPGSTCADVEPIRERCEDLAERYSSLAELLDSITAAPVPVDATDAHLCVLAERYAAECASIPLAEFVTYAAAGPTTLQTPRERLADMCLLRGVEPPTGSDADAIARMLDPFWWRRKLRRLHGRHFERAAMRLGFVSVRAGSYCSDETAERRAQQVERNKAALQSVLVRNEEGQEYNLYDIAQTGMANKSNRKDELMTRMVGCEAVAREMGHVGLFVTATCPSRFHAVLHGKGEVNPKYIKAGSPDPVAGQAWLNGNWARTRAQNGRDGVAPYGFRIAEPHHDGTPHWHMLVFMPRADVEKFVRNMSAHWLADSGDEPGAKSNRIKFVEIDPAKGTAAGYIMKYIGKNIDDSQGAAFDEEGAVDLAGDRPIAPCQRVDAWASVWGIRQFQPLGMPPVTVWRELRRVKEQHAEAPEFIQRALLACHKRTDPETGEVGAIAADFAEYIRAQGGVNVGRDYRIMLAWKGGYAPGRYGVTVRNVPGGVVARGAWGTLYPSKRYAWERAGRVAGVGVPRSPLNNCTQQEGAPEPKAWPNRPTGADCWFSEQSLPVEALEAFVDEWFGSAECAEFVVDPWIVGQEWHQAEVAAAEIRENTVWTHLTGTARLEAAGNNGGSMWN